MNDKTKGCLVLLSLPLWLVAAGFTYAWATQTLWGWFAVPIGAHPVTMAQAYGLRLDTERCSALSDNVMLLRRLIEKA